jgi:nucleoside-diphosphate-sugar epimerase
MSIAFVTGGNGFVGSHLVDALHARGDRVRALVRDPHHLRWLSPDRAEFVPGHLTSAEALHGGIAGVDVIYHCAALTRARTRREMFAVNVEGTRAVLAAAAAAPTPPTVVYLSSQTAWGPSLDGTPVNELTPSAPISDYGRSKVAAEAEIERYAKQTGARTVTVRAPAVYGPRDSGFAVLFRQASHHLLPRILGERRLSIVHVSDLVAGMLPAADRGRGLYTFTDGPPHPMPELLDAIADAVGTRVWRVPLSPAAYVGLVWVWGQLSRIVGSLPPYTAERARESVAPDWSCDDSRARRELGFTSELSLIDGMRATAAWYRAQGLIT